MVSNSREPCPILPRSNGWSNLFHRAVWGGAAAAASSSGAAIAAALLAWAPSASGCMGTGTTCWIHMLCTRIWTPPHMLKSPTGECVKQIYANSVELVGGRPHVITSTYAAFRWARDIACKMCGPKSLQQGMLLSSYLKDLHPPCQPNVKT